MLFRDVIYEVIRITLILVFQLVSRLFKMEALAHNSASVIPTYAMNYGRRAFFIGLLKYCDSPENVFQAHIRIRLR